EKIHLPSVFPSPCITWADQNNLPCLPTYIHTYLPALVHLGRTCGTKSFYPMCLSMHKCSDDDTRWLVLDGRTGGW
ncbi:hypothetical protein RB213_014553, partial [Colletotrichum asianum]